MGNQSLLKASVNILHDSPAQRDGSESVTKSSKFLLLFSAVRWIEYVAVADRLIEVNHQANHEFLGKTSKVKAAFQQKLPYFKDSCFHSFSFES